MNESCIMRIVTIVYYTTYPFQTFSFVFWCATRKSIAFISTTILLFFLQSVDVQSNGLYYNFVYHSFFKDKTHREKEGFHLELKCFSCIVYTSSREST